MNPVSKEIVLLISKLLTVFSIYPLGIYLITGENVYNNIVPLRYASFEAIIGVWITFTTTQYLKSRNNKS